MCQAGGSLSIWLVLLSLKTSHGASQRAMAESMGIQGATLTHHLNGMEECGLGVLDQVGQNVSAGSTASADLAPSARNGG
ncbi:MAG TPA: MarR family winged helix-turn-helix transcriptional regulator [Pseudonocardia sp.]|jgi:predicted transcriptional regulator|nr:MarR family winged helix-turn-helix transcriptional regulator [Pseudonocardia sp.]